MFFISKRLLLKISFVIIVLFNFTKLNSQVVPSHLKTTSQLFTLASLNGSLEQLLTDFEANSNYIFSYSNKINLEKVITFSSSQVSLDQFLRVISDSCSIAYSISNGKVILEPKRISSYNVYGYIAAKEGNERLIGAGIMDMNSLRGLSTNGYGFYSLKVVGDVAVLGVSYIGYKSLFKRIKLHCDTLVNIQLESDNQLAEVSVFSSTPFSVDKSQMSAVSLNTVQMQKLPAFMGEVDLVKSLQLLPGVQSGSEGFSGLNVRGGGNEQNLILLDGVPVYGITHMFGLFSVFNSEAINSMTILKGGFPARYGGRASSVIDLKMFEGNNKRLNGNFSLGLTSIKLGFEGPAFKDKSTFSIAVRRTYHDFIDFKIPTINSNEWNFYFYDIYAKFNHIFSLKSRVYGSFFSSYDVFSTNYNHQQFTSTSESSSSYDVYDSNKAAWGNVIGSVRWNYLLKSNLFCNSQLSFSQYRYNFSGVNYDFSSNEYTSTQKNYFSGVTDGIAKIDFDYIPTASQSIKFGADYTIHLFQPGIELHRQMLESKAMVDTVFGDRLIKGSEMHLYFEDDIAVTNRIRMNCGLRIVGYATSSSNFYFSAEPRLALRYLVYSNFSIKAAYSRTSQFIHLVNSSLISLPTDLWFPVTTEIKPLLVNLVSVGYEWNIFRYTTFSTEGYYKTLENVLDVKDGSGIFGMSPNLTEQITAGNGNSYGLEALLQVTGPRLSGWLGYCYSKTTHHFDQINNGNPFPARFDRRHDVFLTVSYVLKKGVTVGANWVFGSGNAITLSSQKYTSPAMPTPYSANKGQIIELVGSRNGYRMPNYHRLDISASFSKKKIWGERIWSVGVYNVYGRQNPLFVYFSDTSTSEALGSKSLKQLSIFPIPIPYLRYTAKF